MIEPRWRKSSFSGSNHACVEVGKLDGEVLVRNSNHPHAGTLSIGPTEMAAWIAGALTGDLDDVAR